MLRLHFPAQMREVLGKYLEDEDDMLDMNLTAKCGPVWVFSLRHCGGLCAGWQAL